MACTNAVGAPLQPPRNPLPTLPTRGSTHLGQRGREQRLVRLAHQLGDGVQQVERGQLLRRRRLRGLGVEVRGVEVRVVEVGVRLEE